MVIRSALPMAEYEALHKATETRAKAVKVPVETLRKVLTAHGQMVAKLQSLGFVVE